MMNRFYTTLGKTLDTIRELALIVAVIYLIPVIYKALESILQEIINLFL